MQFMDYRMNVAEQLLELHRPLRVRNPGGRLSSLIPSDTNPLRLVGKCFFPEDLSNQIISARHFPSLIPETEAQGSNTIVCSCSPCRSLIVNNFRYKRCMAKIFILP